MNNTMPDLEHVFSEGHQYYDRVFYDYKEGKYYDKYTDMYIELDDLKNFGFPYP